MKMIMDSDADLLCEAYEYAHDVLVKLPAASALIPDMTEIFKRLDEVVGDVFMDQIPYPDDEAELIR